ncbi:peptidogalycan biosysnthesis protein [Streptomyces sp. NPDC058401]|uniref:peptidogalycan biosysnthesis protein n=1 Tax=Streptomyces sp. NPDC058401 TaxID=3346480 RepID=UPI00364DF0D8
MTVETIKNWRELNPLGWSGLVTDEDLFTSPEWLRIEEEPVGPWHSKDRAYLAAVGPRGAEAGLIALLFDESVTEPLCRTDLYVAGLDPALDQDALSRDLLPCVMAGGWFNSRVLLAPGLSGGARRQAVESLVAAAEDFAADSSAGSIAFSCVGAQQHELRSVLTDAGYLALPTGPRHVMSVGWDEYAGYLGSLRSRQRLRVRKEHQRILDSDVSTRVERMDGSNVADVARLARAVEGKYEMDATSDQLEEWFRAIAAAPIPNVLFTADRKGARCASTLWLSRGRHLYGFHSGADYELSDGLPTYFETAYRMPMDYACASAGSIGVLEYGVDSDRAKLNRGSTALDQYVYLKATSPEVQRRLEAGLTRSSTVTG